MRDRFFRDYLDAKSKPGTSKHYMSSLISFLSFAITENIEINSYTLDDYTSMKLRLFNWRKIYNKEIKEQKWIDDDNQMEVLITPEQVALFEQGELARTAVKLFGKVAEDPEYLTSLSEYTNMRDYLMAGIGLANAHRSGVAANMKFEEFQKAKYDHDSDNFLISVKKHKTLRDHGPAVVCLASQKFNFLTLFVTNVLPLFSRNSLNVFVSCNGNNLASGAVSRQINSIWKRSGVYGENIPPKRNISSTIIRKSATTLVHDKFTEESQQPVADLLAHNLSTAKKYYRLKDRLKQAITGTRVISQVFKPTEIPVRLRDAWSPEDESAVESIFKDDISKKEIHMDSVRSKMEKTNVTKTVRQVYDKVRNIIRQAEEGILALPDEEETLAQRVTRMNGAIYPDPPSFNAPEAKETNGEYGDVDYTPSVISPSEMSSSLTGKQKLFDSNDSNTIKFLCEDIAISGTISIQRIEKALSTSEAGRHILEKYRMAQIQTRLKYERRQLKEHGRK